MTVRSQDGMDRTRLAPDENAAAHDGFMNAPVVLQVAASPVSPALVLRPWRMEDVAALVEVSRDPALRQWANSVVDDDADGARWVQAQQQGWAAGDRFGFAVLETQPGSVREQLLGNVVLKEVASGKPAAEVGYWTAAHARGRGVGLALRQVAGRLGLAVFDPIAGLAVGLLIHADRDHHQRGLEPAQCLACAVGVEDA